MSIRGQFNAAEQFWRSLEADVDVSRKGFVKRILYHRTLLCSQLIRATHKCRVRGGLKRFGEACYCLTIHCSQTLNEHICQAFLQTSPGKIRQRLARDGEYFLLGAATDGLI